MVQRLNQLGKAQLENLRSKGITLTDEDVVEIYLLSEKAGADYGDSAFLKYEGYQAGNITLYPLTMGAKVRMEQVIAEWFEYDTDMQEVLLFYAMAHTHEEKAFDFKSRDQAKRILLSWAIRIRATPQQLYEAVTKMRNRDGGPIDTENIYDLVSNLLQQIDAKETRLDVAGLRKWKERYDSISRPIDTIPALAVLLHFFPGETQEHWLWEVSDDVCGRFITKAAEMVSTVDSKTIRSDDPCVMAYKKLMRYTQGLIEKSTQCQKN